MEFHRIEFTSEGLFLPEFSNSEKAVQLSGQSAEMLADLALHLADLSIALECIEQINKLPVENFYRRILWRMAIILCMKCYGSNKGRAFQLQSDIILKEDEEGQSVFKYFKNLRNKNIVHDENSLSQSLPAAIINRKDANKKIEKIICLNVEGETSSAENIENLQILINKSLNFIRAKYDMLAKELIEELSLLDYETLIKMQDLKYLKPQTEEVGKTRAKSP